MTIGIQPVKCPVHGRVLGQRQELGSLAFIVLLLLTAGLILPLLLAKRLFAPNYYLCPHCGRRAAGFIGLPVPANLFIILVIVLAALAGAFKG
jgi:hypothetical protein